MTQYSMAPPPHQRFVSMLCPRLLLPARAMQDMQRVDGVCPGRHTLTPLLGA